MDATQTRHRIKLVPVRRLGNPIQVIPQERVITRIRRHKRVAEHHRRMTHTVLRISIVFQVVQEEGIDTLVVTEEVLVGVD
jgi:hypothetical protein